MSGDLGNANWYGDIQCFDGVAQTPRSAEDIAGILRDSVRYPSPVRPMGSRHSVTACMAARAPGQPERWGTGVDMTAFTQLGEGRGSHTLDRAAGTVTVPAGRTFMEVARELRQAYGVQLRVNTELGTLTMGAAACGGTKDSSFPDEPGQVCSDVVGLRLVTPSGEIRNMRAGERDFDAVLGSYGLLGIVTEVTYRVFQHNWISIEHEEIKVEEFEARSREWLDGRTAVFLYLFPHAGRIVAELRRKGGPGKGDEYSTRLAVRNHFWRKSLPEAAHRSDQLSEPARDDKLDGNEWLLRKFIAHGLDLSRVSPVDQIVDFSKGGPRFAFSMWGFPANGFGRILSEYFDFYRSGNYRTSLPHVSYHIARDRSSLLSYSYDNDVWSLDPVATGSDPRWHDFLRAFNDWCSERGATPLLNQTPHLERRHVERGFGERLRRFEETRRRFDSRDRMLNDYFANLLR